ncbi:ABC transporter ATP-binding protein [Natronomonas sp. LN261]|uniref:ABC transporter ATP-binding protein n=1 Tax=Natronomonas sp. LN261 TaxID=2750669 RepID=UPI001C68043E|nr:ABC transporter ATP-binding protein [Natronomonas sp. LN261]
MSTDGGAGGADRDDAGTDATGIDTDTDATGVDTDTDAGTNTDTDATGVDTDTDAGTRHTLGGDAILRIRGLDAGYGDLQILSDVDLDVADGEYVTIVGPNGAGKSTVMKTVFGLTTYMDGSVEFEGAEIQGNAPEEIIRRGVGFVPQTDNVFPGLSVRENLEMGAYILDSVPEDRIEEIYGRFPILREREGQKAGTLSGGQQQMVAMGRALMLDPDLLLLDEPSAGLAPDLVSDMFDRIDRINDSGTAILMVEQNAKEALRRCDRGYVLVDGENRYTDRGDVLLGDDDVRQDFLGG